MNDSFEPKRKSKFNYFKFARDIIVFLVIVGGIIGLIYAGIRYVALPLLFPQPVAIQQPLPTPSQVAQTPVVKATRIPQAYATQAPTNNTEPAPLTKATSAVVDNNPTSEAQPTPEPTMDLTDPADGLPEFKGAIAQWTPYSAIDHLIKALHLDKKHGFHLTLINLCETDENCWDEARQADELRSGEKIQFLKTTLDKSISSYGIGTVKNWIDESKGQDLWICDQSVQSLDDLKAKDTQPAKSTAYQKGSISETIAYYGYSLAGVAPSPDILKPVDNIETTTDDSGAVNIFLTGKSNCVVLWQPYDTDALKRPGAHIMTDTNELRVALDVTMYGPKVPEGDPIGQAYMDAYFEAMKYIQEYPEDAAKQVFAYLKANNLTEWLGVKSADEIYKAFKDIPMATLQNNVDVMKQRAGAVADRMEDLQRVLKWGGRVPGNLTRQQLIALIDPSFVMKTAENQDYFTTAQPLNDGYSFTSKPKLPELTQDQLDLSKVFVTVSVEFQPDNIYLTEIDKTNLREKVVPIMLSSPTLYLRINASSANPYKQYSDQNIHDYTEDRLDQLGEFFKRYGIDPSRIIRENRPPQYADSKDPNDWRKDRTAFFYGVIAGR